MLEDGFLVKFPVLTLILEDGPLKVVDSMTSG